MKQRNHLMFSLFGSVGSQNQKNEKSPLRFFWLSLLPLLYTALAVGQTTVSVNPTTNALMLGDSLTLDVVVNNVTNLHAVQTVITFENPIIQSYAIANGPFLGTSGQNVFFSANPSPGPSVNSITVDQAILGYATASGSGVLFVVKFRAVGSGTSLVTLPSVDLRDLANNHISATVSSGSVSVNLISSATIMTTAPNPSSLGQNVVLTATVSPGGATGMVTFFDGATLLGLDTLSGGIATMNVWTLGVGTHGNMTASYGGDANYSGSTSTAHSHTVNQASSATLLTTAPNPSTFGQNVTLTATVTPGEATGTVAFYDSVTSLGTGSVSGGTATLDISTLAVGNHTNMLAVYSGNANYSGSTSVGYSHMVVASTVTVQYPMTNFWNLLSLPLTVEDSSKAAVFATAISYAFAFDRTAGYVRRDTLDHGIGYWLKFPSAQNVSITGMLRREDTVLVHAGWNMIGSISYPVDTSLIIQIPAGIVISRYFEFAGTYLPTDVLQPAKGYWIKTSQGGKLVLQSSVSGQDREARLPQLQKESSP